MYMTPLFCAKHCTAGVCIVGTLEKGGCVQHPLACVTVCFHDPTATGAKKLVVTRRGEATVDARESWAFHLGWRPNHSCCDGLPAAVPHRALRQAWDDASFSARRGFFAKSSEGAPDACRRQRACDCFKHVPFHCPRLRTRSCEGLGRNDS